MLKKKFLKTKCKVTFELPDKLAESIHSAYVVGDFNDWNEQSTPLKKNKNGYSTTLELELDKEYQFRYLINDSNWHNEWQADKYTRNPFHGENSVVVTYNTNGNGKSSE